jgi:DNA-binding response OmpR family regulator
MAPSADGANARPTILLVEDELLLALDVEFALEEWGYAISGPAATLADAGALLDARRPAAALLDVNVQGHSVAPFAQRLVAAGVPFALHTGYTEQHLKAPVLRAAPRLPKPLDRRRLRHLLDELLAAR